MNERNNIPVYAYDFEFAKRWNQEDLYKLSHNANVDCRMEIERTMRLFTKNSEDAKTLVRNVKKILHTFSPERVMFVCSATIRTHIAAEKGGVYTLLQKQWSSHDKPLMTQIFDYVLQLPSSDVKLFMDVCREIEG